MKYTLILLALIGLLCVGCKGDEAKTTSQAIPSDSGMAMASRPTPPSDGTVGAEAQVGSALRK